MLPAIYLFLSFYLYLSEFIAKKALPVADCLCKRGGCNCSPIENIRIRLSLLYVDVDVDVDVDVYVYVDIDVDVYVDLQSNQTTHVLLTGTPGPMIYNGTLMSVSYGCDFPFTIRNWPK